jgi:hypothetical protein
MDKNHRSLVTKIIVVAPDPVGPWYCSFEFITKVGYGNGSSAPLNIPMRANFSKLDKTVEFKFTDSLFKNALARAARKELGADQAKGAFIVDKNESSTSVYYDSTVPQCWNSELKAKIGGSAQVGQTRSPVPATGRGDGSSLGEPEQTDSSTRGD